MSQNPPESYFIDRYNFSRRVVDHRIPYDLNYAINKPVLSRSWISAWKNKWINNLTHNFAIYGSLFICGLAFVAASWDMSHREKYYPP